MNPGGIGVEVTRNQQWWALKEKARMAYPDRDPLQLMAKIWWVFCVSSLSSESFCSHKKIILKSARFAVKANLEAKGDDRLPLDLLMNHMTCALILSPQKIFDRFRKDSSFLQATTRMRQLLLALCISWHRKRRCRRSSSRKFERPEINIESWITTSLWSYLS